MDKTTQLFVRACKSTDYETRLMSVYSRFYLVSAFGNCDTNNTKAHIARILAKICDDADLFTTQDLLTDLSPSSHWKFIKDDEFSYPSLCLNVLASKIRFSSVDAFAGLSTPLKFKRAA